MAKKRMCNHCQEVKDMFTMFTDKPHPALGQFLTPYLATLNIVGARSSDLEPPLRRQRGEPHFFPEGLTRMGLNIFIVGRKLLKSI